MAEQTVAVIGGGVSGLAVTYELLSRARRSSRPLRLICLEGQERHGGNIRSERESGFLCEWGPNGFLDNAPATLDLVRRLGLGERLVRAEQIASRRFIYRKGRLRLLPTGALSFLTSDVLPVGGKLRLLAEPFIGRKRDQVDESVFDFAARRIGRSAASILVDAMVSGIHAGNSHQLSLPAAFPRMHQMEREHGGLVRAMLARMRKSRRSPQGGGPAGPGGRLSSFRDGMAELTDALAREVGDCLQTRRPVIAVSHMGQRGLRVHLREGPPLDTHAVVLAGPAWDSARLVASMDPEMAAAMGAVPSAPVVVVHFGYQSAALGQQPTGFGFLVPRGEGLRMLGCLWTSHIFAGRAPAERWLMTTMLAGAHDPDAVNLNDRELTHIVRSELQKAMGIRTPPYFSKIIRHPRGIPQYDLGHLDRVATIERRRSDFPGLWVSGNSYQGVSVNACAEEAPKIADSIIEFLR